MEFRFDELFGNEDIKEFAAGAVSSGNIPSSFIIEGGEGSGRRTFVRLLFKTVCCTDDIRPCGECAFCRRIENGNSGDLRYFGISDGKKSVGVEESRKIRDDCLLGPSDGDYKFYVIQDADKLTPAAQNALLKLTEEPPAFAKFFFICESAVSLLPTLRSRSAVLRMQKIDSRRMTDYLIKNVRSAAKLYNEDRERFDLVINKSDGCIGQALELLKKRKTDGDLPGDIVSAVLTGRRSEIHTALLALPDTRTEYKDALSDLREALSEEMKICDESQKTLISRVFDLVSEEYGN